MNIGIFAGRLGRDGELRTTPSGKQVLNFSLAVDTFGGGDKKETLWVSCAVWGERADKLAPFMAKGKQVTVSGDVGLRSYTTQAGESRAEITCNVQRLTLQGGAEKSADRPTERAPAAAPAQRSAPAQDEFDDTIPF